MRKSIFIPAPPQASWEQSKSAAITAEIRGSSAGMQPTAFKSQLLDAAFLCRLYRSVLWFSMVATLLVYLSTKAAGAGWANLITLSFAAGAAVGALLLKSQEIIVSRALAARTGRDKSKAARSLWLWLLVPCKYLLVTLGLAWAIRSGHLNIVGFGLGFFAVQMAMTMKLVGLVLARRVRPVREAYATVKAQRREIVELNRKPS